MHCHNFAAATQVKWTPVLYGLHEAHLSTTCCTGNSADFGMNLLLWLEPPPWVPFLLAGGKYPDV
jgi:uncharacterized membrane protein YoaK (UPF0700 family)